MKKSICMIAAAVAFMTATVTNVRAQSYEEGNVLVSAGWGFGNLSKAVFKLYEANTGFELSSFGPIFAKGEYAVSDKVGLGVNFAYLGMKAGFDYTGIDDNGDLKTYRAELGHNGYSILGRVNFHFANGDKIDPYFGIGAGYRGGSWTFTDNQTGSDFGFGTLGVQPVGFETTLGIRYYVVDMLGIYAEIGIAKAPIQLGLTLKL